MPWPDKPKQKALRAIAESVTRAYERWEPGTEFGLAAEAKAAWESFYESWTNQARKDGDLPTSKMESRIPEHTVKLALCYAALENTEATISVTRWRLLSKSPTTCARPSATPSATA